MKIKGKTCVVFDIEVLKNVFTCTCKNTETKQIKIDAQNITKAILKNTISKEVQLIGKTYMDYKSQMK